MKKPLVANFSATGTTKGKAEILAKVLGADLQEIVPAKRYTAADLDWHDKKSRSSVEMADKSSRPAIAGTVANMADYDIVFALASGVREFYGGGWMKRPGEVITCCDDGLRPVFFKLEATDEEAGPFLGREET